MSELLRVIGEGAGAEKDVPEGLEPKDLVEMWRRLVLLRTFDERAVALQRQGRMGTYPTFWGEEATQAGPAYASEERDWWFPSYRQNAIGILRGIRPSTILKYRRGYGGPHGFWNPREHRVAPITISIATHLPHAVGLAWAARIRGEDIASLVWSGDGATSEGDWHEAMNFAAVFRTPTVFFCVNNQWAISTPFSRQTATETIAEKANAYGISSLRVDGFDPVACWLATRDALDRARSGDGPVLIEALCYRLGPHATADDASLYREAREVEPWRALEPVGRMERWLRRLRVLDDAEVESIQAEAKDAMATAVRELEDTSPPGPEVMFETVYASGRPWSFDEALAEIIER